MKSTTLIYRYKEETQKQTQTEVDNRVHPLHWATSPGPSPIGTDPINLLKWYKKDGSGTTSATVKQNVGHKVFKTPLCGITIWSSNDTDPKM